MQGSESHTFSLLSLTCWVKWEYFNSALILLAQLFNSPAEDEQWLWKTGLCSSLKLQGSSHYLWCPEQAGRRILALERVGWDRGFLVF